MIFTTLVAPQGSAFVEFCDAGTAEMALALPKVRQLAGTLRGASGVSGRKKACPAAAARAVGARCGREACEALHTAMETLMLLQLTGCKSDGDADLASGWGGGSVRDADLASGWGLAAIGTLILHQVRGGSDRDADLAAGWGVAARAQRRSMHGAVKGAAVGKAAGGPWRCMQGPGGALR
eukprot:352223-Chlamydomonas_euryale.AAC.4